MRVLIDIGHPASVHFFSNFAKQMEKRGHTILFTIREKDVVKELMDYYNFKYISFGKTPENMIKKMFNILTYSFKILAISIKFKPDLFFTRGAYYLFLSSFLLNKPIISNLNTDVSYINYLLHKLPDCIMTSTSFKYNFPPKKHVRYPGISELALLHPKVFTPKMEILKLYNIKPADRFILVRFVNFKSYDDRGKTGIEENKRVEFIKKLSNLAKVFISSEVKLEKELENLHLELSENYKTGHLQHLEFYASAFVGDSGAMTAECSILATPSIYISNKNLGFIDELVNKYKLAYQVSSPQQGIDKVYDLLKDDNIQETWEKRRNTFISDSINLTNFMIWLIEKYPNSKKEIINNTGIFKYFK